MLFAPLGVLLYSLMLWLQISIYAVFWSDTDVVLIRVNWSFYRPSSGCIHLPCHGPELIWVTDHLLLPDHRYGTVCQQICA